MESLISYFNKWLILSLIQLCGGHLKTVVWLEADMYWYVTDSCMKDTYVLDQYLQKISKSTEVDFSEIEWKINQ